MKFRMGHDQTQPTKLYVLECAGKVKIGIAADVADRVAHLQMACPVKITVAHERLFPTRTLARLAERSLHLQHADARLWGEWFEMDVDVAVAAVVAIEEQVSPVRIPAVPRATVPADTPPPTPPRPIKARPQTGYHPTWDDYEAMSDEVWLEHMQPCAIALEWQSDPADRQERIAAAERALAEKYGPRLTALDT